MYRKGSKLTINLSMFQHFMHLQQKKGHRYNYQKNTTILNEALDVQK